MALYRQTGMNLALWDLRVSNILPAENVMATAPPNVGMQGYKVGPGEYSVKLNYGDFNQTQPLIIKPDPRDEVSPAALSAQLGWDNAT